MSFITYLSLNYRTVERESHLRCLDADYHGVNRCYEPYRSAYLDRVEEVVDAPGNNYVVVKRNEKRHYTRRDPYTA